MTRKTLNIKYIIFCSLIILTMVGCTTKNQNTVDYYFTDKTDEQLVNQELHPRVFDKLIDVEDYVDKINDSRVEVIYTKTGKTQTTRNTEPYANMIVTFDRHPSDYDYIGSFDINIKDTDFATNMTIESAVKIVLSYLPKEFKETYKCDAAYIVDNDNGTTYIYATRLNKDGIEYHNNVQSQYSNYLTFYITKYKSENRWRLCSDYSAYGDHDKGWIEKYTEDWDITLE